MRPPLEITSPDNPRLKAAAKLRESKARRETGLCLVEGERAVGRAVDAGLRVIDVFGVPAAITANPTLRATAVRALSGDPAPGHYHTTLDCLKKLTYRTDPEGLVAVVEQPQWTTASLPSPALSNRFLIASGLEKPGNLGAMARTALATGITALILVDGQADLFGPHAIRSSTGAVFSLPSLSLSRDETVALMASRQCPLYAASPRGTVPNWTHDLSGPFAIVIGAEDSGLDPAWENLATPLTIPMDEGLVDSLNAATAAAILCFEALRQRRATTITPPLPPR